MDSEAFQVRAWLYTQREELAQDMRGFVDKQRIRLRRAFGSRRPYELRRNKVVMRNALRVFRKRWAFYSPVAVDASTTKDWDWHPGAPARTVTPHVRDTKTDERLFLHRPREHYDKIMRELELLELERSTKREAETGESVRAVPLSSLLPEDSHACLC